MSTQRLSRQLKAIDACEEAVMECVTVKIWSIPVFARFTPGKEGAGNEK